MINIQKQPVHNTSLHIHNGTYITKEQWEDELELTAYPFTATLRIDKVLQSLTVTTVWSKLTQAGSAELEKEIEHKMIYMYA